MQHDIETECDTTRSISSRSKHIRYTK